MTQNPDRFVAFLDERTGESLRAVRLYSRDSHRSLYARDDVRRQTADRDVSRLVDRARTELDEHADDVWWFTTGDLEATVRVFRGSVVVNLFASKDHGVLVSLDATATSKLHSFIHDCKTWLADD